MLVGATTSELQESELWGIGDKALGLETDEVFLWDGILAACGPG